MLRAPLPCCLLTVLTAACAGGGSGTAQADSAFQGVQRRGALVMGVDQEASSHRFETLPDGGRIVFTMNDTSDAAGTAVIRRHLQVIADSFAAGVFSDPMLVHAREVLGTAAMGRLKDRISYRYSDLAGGGALRLYTEDPDAGAAIRDFLDFQRRDHRAPGSSGAEHQH